MTAARASVMSRTASALINSAGAAVVSGVVVGLVVSELLLGLISPGAVAG